MKKNIIKIIIWLGIFLLTVGYSYYFRPIVDDELFNFGFANNIINGLIPYKDFNMIITPMFSYILAGILKIFGSKLLVYHVVIASIILLILTISYKTIGKKAFIIYLLLLIYPYTGYNMFCLGLLFILFYIKDNEKVDIIEPIIISMMFLSKQTLGLLIIPSIIYSKNKKKTISIYLIFIFSFLLYLMSNNSLLQFLDYCLLGMFDFANKNSTSIGILTIIEIVILIVLGFLSFITKRKELFFCLIFQIIALPIVDYVHFIISFIPVTYLFLRNFKDKKIISLCGIPIVCSIFLGFNILIYVSGQNYLYLENYPVDNFMKGRVTYRSTEEYVFKVQQYLEEYNDYTPFILGYFSYLIKLNNEMSINKFDLINNGNMGYNGANRYLEEIDSYCKKNKCIFIIDDNEAKGYRNNQTNKSILKYVQETYQQKYSSNTFCVYTN